MATRLLAIACLVASCSSRERDATSSPPSVATIAIDAAAAPSFSIAVVQTEPGAFSGLPEREGYGLSMNKLQWWSDPKTAEYMNGEEPGHETGYAQLPPEARFVTLSAAQLGALADELRRDHLMQGAVVDRQPPPGGSDSALELTLTLDGQTAQLRFHNADQRDPLLAPSLALVDALAHLAGR